MSGTQESPAAPADPRNEKVAIAVTRREKLALRFVSIHRGTTESALLREMLIDDVAAEYDRLMAALERVS